MEVSEKYMKNLVVAIIFPAGLCQNDMLQLLIKDLFELTILASYHV